LLGIPKGTVDELEQNLKNNFIRKMTDKQYDRLISKLDQIAKLLSYQILPEGNFN
jgi:hypothetical protein